MVKIGDKIKTEHGKTGTVVDIHDTDDGRYVILYKKRKNLRALVEGDEEFKVIRGTKNYIKDNKL